MPNFDVWCSGKNDWGASCRLNKAIQHVHHKFENPKNVEFDIFKDVHERTLISIQDIHKKTPRTSWPLTPPIKTQMTNANTNKGDTKVNDKDEVIDN